MLCAVIGSKLGRWDRAATAMWAHLVVVAAPFGDLCTSLRERREPLLVEALVAELAVEAFDVTVLHGLARIDQQVLDVVPFRPRDEGPAREFRAIVGPHGARVAAEAGRLVQHAYHVSTTDAVIDRDVDALVAEVIGNGQAFEPTTVGQGIADKIHAPDRVGTTGRDQSLTLGRWPPDLPASAYGEVRLAVQTIDLLVVHAGKLLVQQVMQTTIAEPASHLCQFDDACRQRLRGGCRLGPVTVGVA